MDDVALERRTLANAAWVDVWHFHPQECLEKGTKAIELASQAGDDQTEINARRSIIWALMGSGDEREQIHAHTTAEFALAEKLRDSWSLASAGFDNARMAVFEGDWETARHMSDVGSMAEPRGPRCARDAGPARVRARQLRPGCGAHRSAAGRRRRRAPPGPIAEHPFMVGAIALTERIAGTDERLTSAATSAEALLSLPHLAPAFAMVARSALALIAVQRNEPEAAKEQYHAIEPHKRTGCFIIPFTFDRILANLAITLGQIDTAITHYEDGSDLLRPRRLSPRTRLDSVRLRRRSSRP